MSSETEHIVEINVATIFYVLGSIAFLFYILVSLGADLTIF